MKIVVDHVTKSYQPAQFVALDDICIAIEPSEWVFLVGASGTGKSTLLKLIYKEEVPDTGTVLVGEDDTQRIAGSRLRRSIGVIFQSFRLLQTKSAFENIAYAAEVIGTPPGIVRQRTNEILELVGLQDKARRLPSELSGGEQQRVAIGRALINRPQLIVADEPTGDLDPENSQRVLDILERVHRENKTTIVFATHAVDVVDRLNRRVIRLDRGRIVRDSIGGYWNAGPPS